MPDQKLQALIVRAETAVDEKEGSMPDGASLLRGAVISTALTYAYELIRKQVITEVEEALTSKAALEAGAGEWPANCVPHLCKLGDPPEFIASQQAANEEWVRRIIAAALATLKGGTDNG